MDERRKNKRLDLQSTIVANRIDIKEPREVNIDIFNVSKTGIGFTCDQPLMIGAVYEAHITLWSKEVIHVFMEIIRIEKKENCFEYGAIFIGMPETDAMRIDLYRLVDEMI